MNALKFIGLLFDNETHYFQNYIEVLEQIFLIKRHKVVPCYEINGIEL